MRHHLGPHIRGQRGHVCESALRGVQFPFLQGTRTFLPYFVFAKNPLCPSWPEVLFFTRNPFFQFLWPEGENCGKTYLWKLINQVVTVIWVIKKTFEKMLKAGVTEIVGQKFLAGLNSLTRQYSLPGYTCTHLQLGRPGGAWDWTHKDANHSAIASL